METANKTIELVSKRSLTCKQPSIFIGRLTCQVRVKYFSPLNSVAGVATCQVVKRPKWSHCLCAIARGQQFNSSRPLSRICQ